MLDQLRQAIGSGGDLFAKLAVGQVNAGWDRYRWVVWSTMLQDVKQSPTGHRANPTVRSRASEEVRVVSPTIAPKVQTSGGCCVGASP